MDTSTTEKVAIIAADALDKQLIARLLDKANYASAMFASNDGFSCSENAHTAVVVCHRHSSAEPLPSLPLCVDGQRVIVFSDCTLEQTIVSALEAGAHHIFDLSETPAVLQARLDAALRQHSLQTPRILDVAPFKFNLERRSVHLDGKIINLSPKEYEFAYYLFANRHRVVVNAELMTSVWSLPSSMDARRIDTAACRVRKKMHLGESTDGWSLRRIRRVGYELLWCGEMQAASEPEIQASRQPSENKAVSSLAHDKTDLRESA